MITNKFDLKSQYAFTLIELMIVVAIIGILASIAFPSYQRSVSKSRMTDTKGVLLEFSNAMERYYTEFNTYCDAASGGTGQGVACVGGGNDSGPPIATLFPNTSPIDGSTVYYNLTMTVLAPGVTYTLTATPLAGGVQANNLCGTLSLSSTGLRGFTGAAGTRLTCW